MTSIGASADRQTRIMPAQVGSYGLAFSLHEKIDICRGVFAALVVVAHALEIAWAIHPGASEALSPLARDVLSAVPGTGIYYVMGFFVLSGYCIHLSVARSLAEQRFSVGTYTIARLSRLLPLYYVALLVTVAVELAIAGARPHEWPHGIHVSAFLGQLILIQNLTQTFGSFASSWSITNEGFYYLFYGFLAWILAGRAARPAWVGLGVCAAAALVGQGLYVIVARNAYVYSAGMLFGLGMLWFQGALVAIYGRDWVARAWVRRFASLWPLVLAIAIGWKTLHLPPHGLYLISGWAFTLMILDFLRGPLVNPQAEVGAWRSGLVTTLGLCSYPMYLFHGPLLMLAGSWMMRTGLVADWRLSWGLLTALGIGLGVALGWGLERPVMRWRAGLLRRIKDRAERADSEAREQTPRPDSPRSANLRVRVGSGT
jgi:peptidoglycan/LPS O-acetylase OafA/YrhL